MKLNVQFRNETRRIAMKMRFIATLAMAATAAAIGLAPVAAAAPTGTITTNTGGATVVQSPGNAQVTAQPGAAAVQAGQLQYPFFGDTACRASRSITAATIADGANTVRREAKVSRLIRLSARGSRPLRRHADGRPRDRSASHPDLGLVGGPRRRTARPVRLRRRGIDGRRRRRGRRRWRWRRRR